MVGGFAHVHGHLYVACGSIFYTPKLTFLFFWCRQKTSINAAHQHADWNRKLSPKWRPRESHSSVLWLIATHARPTRLSQSNTSVCTSIHSSGCPSRITSCADDSPRSGQRRRIDGGGAAGRRVCGIRAAGLQRPPSVIRGVFRGREDAAAAAAVEGQLQDTAVGGVSLRPNFQKNGENLHIISDILIAFRPAPHFVISRGTDEIFPRVSWEIVRRLLDGSESREGGTIFSHTNITTMHLRESSLWCGIEHLVACRAANTSLFTWK